MHTMIFLEPSVTNLVESICMSLFACSGELVQSLFYAVFSCIFSGMSLYAVILACLVCNDMLYILVCMFICRRRQQPVNVYAQTDE